MRTHEILALIGDVLARRGAELVDLECSGTERRPLLRAFVDVPGGTTADACAEISRALEAGLEASGLVGERYVLEVSSPGLDRPLRTRRDFARLLGHPVRLRLRGGPAGGGERVGVVEEVGEGEGAEAFWIALRPERATEVVRVPAEDIAEARACVAWPRRRPS